MPYARELMSDPVIFLRKWIGEVSGRNAVDTYRHIQKDLSKAYNHDNFMTSDIAQAE